MGARRMAQAFSRGLSGSGFEQNLLQMFELGTVFFSALKELEILSEVNNRLLAVFCLHFKGEQNLWIILLCLF